MFYTVYKITNLVNGKIYIGVHKTDDLNDDYMGSGTYLKLAQEKYGIENFVREYLQVFDNAEDMFKMESELVNEEFVSRDDTYNLIPGGQFGTFDYENCRKMCKLKYPNGTFFGKVHSDETKKKIGCANAIQQRGDKNSQFGTMWIMNPNLKESKRIYKDEPIPEGWVKGRKQYSKTLSR